MFVLWAVEQLMHHRGTTEACQLDIYLSKHAKPNNRGSASVPAGLDRRRPAPTNIDVWGGGAGYVEWGVTPVRGLPARPATPQHGNGVTRDSLRMDVWSSTDLFADDIDAKYKVSEASIPCVTTIIQMLGNYSHLSYFERCDFPYI